MDLIVGSRKFYRPYNETPTDWIVMNKNTAKQKLISTKNKIAKNQTKIMGTALVVTTAAAAIMIRAKVISDQFLKEKGLYDEFYTPDAADIEN